MMIYILRLNMKFYKYQGAGNDFLIADNRDGAISLTSEQVAALCDRRYGVGADGLMLLEAPADRSTHEARLASKDGFAMTYYNSDGSGGMMCGNGGRCIVAFAADMGVTDFSFSAADGYHRADILGTEGRTRTVRLLMKDVKEYEYYKVLTGTGVPSDGYFLDTGTRHFVRIVEDLDNYDVVSEGRDIRYRAAELQPVGVNVNFIEPSGDLLKVRTYEKGVEDETFACGTGIVASCIAAYKAGIRPAEIWAQGKRVRYHVQAKRDLLSVEFTPSDLFNGVAEEIYLTGPAAFVAEIDVPYL